jgi:N-acetylmuramic acid 6-phosphate etherase
MTEPIPDRSHILTEHRNPRSMDLHRLSIDECVRLIGEEDAQVFRALELARPQIVAFIRAIEPGFCAGGRLIYIGAGTSGRLGVLDASEAPPTFQVDPGRIVGIIAGGDAALRRSSEGKEDDPWGARAELQGLNLRAGDAMLGIAAGGTTPYVLGALSVAKALQPGVITGLMTCTPIGSIPDLDYPVYLPTGPEVLTGSTRMKAGTATKLALNTISTTLMVRSGRVYQNLMVDVRATNQKLRDRAARIVTELTGLDRAGALLLLDEAQGSTKAAIVMHRLGVCRMEAEDLLARAGGRLDVVIDGDERRRKA